ncbi:MAG: cation:proton antiporter [Bacteroidota bacterium]|nr:cation:proton antiporter [Bacteroidota bacterium]
MQEFIEKLTHEFQTPFGNSVLIFSLILFIILLAPIVLNRFKIPGIIGLILSGMIIGPYGLFLVQKNSAVDLFSTIGLLYIMFIAGLELDMNEFNKHKYKSLIFGLLTFVFPIAIGLPVCYYLLGYTFSTSLLVASMFATHTLIAYPIVNRLGIAKNQAVAITVGGTILTDTAVLLILAIISGTATGQATSELWLRLLISIVCFSAIVYFLIPRVASWFFRRLEDEKNAHFIFVLLVVFLTAFLAEIAGLEPIIGAFAAGLTLNRLIPHTSSLMNRIEFVGNALFIPFFLISVGMLIDFRVLTNGPQALIVAASLTVVALVGKWIAAQATGRIFAYSKGQRGLIFGLSSSHAAATLAVILVGYNIGIIDDHILNGTIVLILVTCIVASFVTEQAGKEVVLHMDNEPEQAVANAQRVLVPIANPETMEKLIDFSMVIKNPKDYSPILGLTIVKDDDQAQARLLQSKKLLDKAIVYAASADQKIEIMSTIDRNVTSGIKRIATEKFITDIVAGWSSQKNLADIIFGQTFDKLVKQTTQTIFITRFAMPLNVHQKIVLICPYFAEKEPGFYKWLISIFRAASQLSTTIQLHAPAEVERDIREFMNANKMALSIDYRGHLDLGDVALLVPKLQPYDMVVLVSSREGGISHTPALDVLPKKMSRYFQLNSLVFIYPATATDNVISNYEQEISGGLLGRSIDMLKTAKNIFRKRTG